MSLKRKFKVIGSLIFTLILIISCMIPALATNPDTWTTMASMTTGRSQFYSVACNGKIYAFGGTNGSTQVTTVEEYNPSTNTWTAKAPMPGVNSLAAAAVADGKIYFIDGKNYYTYSDNVVYIYDTVTNKWKTRNNTTARSDHQVAVLNGKIYVIGGTRIYPSGTITLNSVEVYDPVADTWTNLAAMNTARKYFRVAVANGKIYAIGGSNTSSDFYTSVEEYDPATDTWTTKASLNTGRHSFELAVINSKIYVIGGDSNINVQTNTVEEYDPATNTWATKASMSVARKDFELITVNDNIYVMGGQTTSGGYIASVEQYNVATNVWTTKAALPTKLCYFEAAVVGDGIYVMGGNNGVSSSITTVRKYTLPPTAPTNQLNLSATAGNTKVDLSWSSISIATSYNLFRSETAGGPYTQIATDLTGTTYTDSSVTNGTTYYYVATAVNSVGESSYSNEVSATPNASGTTPTGDATLSIYMVDGALKEYNLTMEKINDFIAWYDGRATGTGKFYYIFDKTYSSGTYTTGKEYLIFDKIKDFEIKQ